MSIRSAPDFAAFDFGVRQLLARMVDAVWRQDCPDFARCYAPDGEWKIAGMHMTGRDAVREGAEKLLTRYDSIHLMVGMPMLQLDGATGIGRYNMTEIARLPDGTAFLCFGWYFDRYALVGDSWLFSWRHWHMKYRGPLTMDGHWPPTDDYGSFPGMPQPDEPRYTQSG